MNTTPLEQAKALILHAIGPHGIRSECASRGIKFVGEPNAAGWLTCSAVDREDQSPSAAVCVGGSGGELGRYKDLGGDGLSLSFWDLLAMLSPAEFPDWFAALKYFADATGVALPSGGAATAAGGNGQAPAAASSPGQPDSDGQDIAAGGAKQPAPLDEQFTVTDWFDDHPEYFRLLTRGLCEVKSPVTADAIRAAGGEMASWPAKSQSPLGVVALPAFRGTTTSPAGYALLRTNGQLFPGIEGGIPERKVHVVAGSKDGWIVVGGMQQLKSADVIWRCEGVTDAIGLATVLPEKHIAVSNIFGALASVKCPMGIFKGRRVNVIGDCDEPGETGTVKFASKVSATAAEVRRIVLPFPVTKSHGKDVRDYLTDGNGFTELAALAESSPVITQEAMLAEVSTTHASQIGGRVEIESVSSN